MTQTDFDAINIEYMEDGEETFDYPEEMLVSVETREDDHYTHTKDSIRVKIKSYIRRNFGNNVEVIDFLAFPIGSEKALGQDFEAESLREEYERHWGEIDDEGAKGLIRCKGCDEVTSYYDEMKFCEACKGRKKEGLMDEEGNFTDDSTHPFYEYPKPKYAETFEAKQIGSIRIVKNPNFPSGTSLQAYIKTNRAELRKVFGNPNMGESGDGKSKGKQWNLVVGPHRVTIYDKREKDKKGTKYFNIGGSRKYGALLVAQALSIHRNERVYAKEIVPQWLEDKRQYQQVKSIDEHPDLTYERAKQYEDNRRRYGAETFDVEFNEWAEQEMMSHGKDISFKDWAEDEGMKHGDVPITEWAEHEEESHDARYGAETGDDYVDYTMWIYTKSTGGLFSGEWEDGESEEQVVKEWKELVREAIEQNGDDLITADLRRHSNYDEEGVSETTEFLFEYEHGEDNLEDFESENWGHHELDSHYERYGAESFEDFKRKMVGDNFIAGDVGYMEALEDFYEEYLEEFEEITDEFCPKPETFEEFQERVLKNDYEMSLEAENWGGNPKGQLATALRNARIKAKQPKKPLKIEKLDAETDPLWLEKVKHQHYKDMITHLESLNELTEMDNVKLQHYKDMVKMGAESSGQWEIGEQLEEAQMNAEEKKVKSVIENAMKEYDEYVADKEAYDDDDIISFEEWFDDSLGNDELEGDEETLEYLKTLPSYNSPESNLWIWEIYHGDKYKFAEEKKKRSGVLSDPFNELSLDSGDWKGIVAGFGIGLLALFGYSKLRK